MMVHLPFKHVKEEKKLKNHEKKSALRLIVTLTAAI